MPSQTSPDQIGGDIRDKAQCDSKNQIIQSAIQASQLRNGFKEHNDQEHNEKCLDGRVQAAMFLPYHQPNGCYSCMCTKAAKTAMSIETVNITSFSIVPVARYISYTEKAQRMAVATKMTAGM